MELSKLESKIAPVFKKLLQAQVDGNRGEGGNCVTLPQSEYFLLKKFIFVMNYRSSVFYKQYNHERQDDYHDKDKGETLVLPYLQDRQRTCVGRQLCHFERGLRLVRDRLQQQIFAASCSRSLSAEAKRRVLQSQE